MKTTDLSLERQKRQQERDALDDIIVQSRAGRDFCLHAVRQCNYIALKQTFSGMARIHSAMIEESELMGGAEKYPKKNTNNHSPTVVDISNQPYHPAIGKMKGSSDYELLQVVEDNEAKILGTIRTAIRRIRTKDVRQRLAAKIASIQMDCDRIRSLKHSTHFR